MLRRFLLILIALVPLLCPGQPTLSATDRTMLPAENKSVFFEEWQVWEVKTGHPIIFESLMTDLAGRDVIYLGEEHHNKWHIEAALKVLTALLSYDRHPILALEMFGWDGQAALDRYLADRERSRDQFIEGSRWKQNWGGALEDYEPLVTFARDQHLPVLALNPPKSLVRLVAKRGLAEALADPGMIEWGMKDEQFPEDPAYHDMIVKPLRQCHSGLSDEDYQRMYEASTFRDEGMAKTITDALRHRRAGTSQTSSQAATQAGPIVSYTGGGHIQYQLPVPNRVLRRSGGVRQTTIYMISFEPARADEIRTLMKEAVADYIWLTPLSPQGAPRRCR